MLSSSNFCCNSKQVLYLCGLILKIKDKIMNTILGQASVIGTTEADVVSASIALPTAARVHALTSDSPEDTNTQVAQVETATVVGTITGDGNATVIVTSAGMTGSPKTVNVAVLTDDTPAEVAVKIQTALIADDDIGHETTGKFTVTVDEADVILTANAIAVNDTTLNIDINNGTCTGLTDSPTSTSTTAGSTASGAKIVRVKGLNSSYSPIEETVSLNGTTGVNTTNSYVFINEIEVISSVDNVGVISATAATDSTVTCTVPAGEGKSQQAYFMVPDDTFKYTLDSVYLNAINVTSTALTTVKIKTKAQGTAWITERIFKLNANGQILDKFVSMPLPARSAVKLTAVSSSGNTNVTGMMTIS